MAMELLSGLPFYVTIRRQPDAGFASIWQLDSQRCGLVSAAVDCPPIGTLISGLPLPLPVGHHLMEDALPALGWPRTGQALAATGRFPATLGTGGQLDRPREMSSEARVSQPINNSVTLGNYVTVGQWRELA